MKEGEKNSPGGKQRQKTSERNNDRNGESEGKEQKRDRKGAGTDGYILLGTERHSTLPEFTLCINPGTGPLSERAADRHTDTDTWTHRHTDTWTRRHTDTDTQTHRHMDTRTEQHRDAFR